MVKLQSKNKVLLHSGIEYSLQFYKFIVKLSETMNLRFNWLIRRFIEKRTNEKLILRQFCIKSGEKTSSH